MREHLTNKISKPRLSTMNSATSRKNSDIYYTETSTGKRRGSSRIIMGFEKSIKKGGDLEHLNTYGTSRELSTRSRMKDSLLSRQTLKDSWLRKSVGPLEEPSQGWSVFSGTSNPSCAIPSSLKASFGQSYRAIREESLFDFKELEDEIKEQKGRERDFTPGNGEAGGDTVRFVNRYMREIRVSPTNPLSARLSTKGMVLPMKFRCKDAKPNWEVYIGLNYRPDEIRYSYYTDKGTFILDSSLGQLSDRGFLGFFIKSSKEIKTSAGCAFAKTAKQLNDMKQREAIPVPTFKKDVKIDYEDFTEFDLDLPQSKIVDYLGLINDKEKLLMSKERLELNKAIAQNYGTFKKDVIYLLGKIDSHRGEKCRLKRKALKSEREAHMQKLPDRNQKWKSIVQSS